MRILEPKTRGITLNNEIMDHFSVEVLLPAIQVYNGYKTSKTKDQWKIELGPGDLRQQVSNNKEWLTASIETQEGHYVQWNMI